MVINLYFYDWRGNYFILLLLTEQLYYTSIADMVIIATN